MKKDLKKISNASIWKIDKNSFQFRSIESNGKAKPSTEVVNKIIDSSDKNIKRININSNDSMRMSCFVYTSSSKGILDLIDHCIDDGDRSEFEGFSKNGVLFFYKDEDIYCLTFGSGYHLISQYADKDFPFDFGIRVYSGSFSAADSIGVSGPVYHQSGLFRGSGYRFGKREGYGKIWKKMIGPISKQIIKKSPVLAEILRKKQVNLEIKSSITFKKSLNLDEIFLLMKEISELMDEEPTKENKRKFAFMQTLKRVADDETKNNLYDALFKRLHAIGKSKDYEKFEEFDFFLYKDDKTFLNYINANSYELIIGTGFRQIIKESDVPKITDVLQVLFENKEGIDRESVFKNSMVYDALKVSTDSLTREYKLYEFIEGEVVFNGKTYFLIDGEFYDASQDLLAYLKQDFIEEFFGDQESIESEIPFIDWKKILKDGGTKKYIEDDFNKKQAECKNFYLGDKVFYSSDERGKIELFDLLYHKKNRSRDDELFIIHVKNGFNGSMRDACSQVRMSAEVIENAIQNGDELKEFYKKFKKVNEERIGYSTFMKMLRESKRTYVLAPGVISFTKEDFESKKLHSHISKFETLELQKNIKQTKARFLLQPIFKVND